jgi:hypothetical protein
MIGQGSVGEPESTVVVGTHEVHDPGTVQRPEAQMPNQDGHDRADFDACVSRERFNPADVELLPRQQGCARPIEIIATLTDDHPLFVESSAGWPLAHNPNFTVGQWQVTRRGEEAFDVTG